jgi:hypothetical protein
MRSSGTNQITISIITIRQDCEGHTFSPYTLPELRSELQLFGVILLKIYMDTGSMLTYRVGEMGCVSVLETSPLTVCDG